HAEVADGGADSAFMALQHGDLAATHGQRAGHGQADDAGTDHEGGCVFHGGWTQTGASAGMRARRRALWWKYSSDNNRQAPPSSDRWITALEKKRTHDSCRPENSWPSRTSTLPR